MASLQPTPALLCAMGSVYAASTFLVELLSDGWGVPFLHSEWLCWLFLLVLTRFTDDSKNKSQAEKLSLGIAAACVCWAFGDARWTLPLSTPLCLLITTSGAPIFTLPIADTAEKPDSSQQASDLYGTPRTTRVFVIASIISILSAVAFFPFQSITEICMSLGFLASITSVYFVIHQEKHESAAAEESQTVFSNVPARSTAWRVLATLTMMAIVPSNRPTEAPFSLALLVAALLKAARWISIFGLIKSGLLLPMSTTATFVTSLWQTIALPVAGWRVELVFGAGLVSLVQTYGYIRNRFTNIRQSLSSRLFFLTIVAIALTIWAFSRANQVHGKWTSIGRQWQGSGQHPIEVLVSQANEQFEAMVSRQSKTVGQAVAEYKRRYKRVPPPGFEEWFNLAIEANLTIVDEFDTLMDGLNPFWGISAREMRARASMVHDNPMAVVKIVNHEASMPVEKLYLGGFAKIIMEWINMYKHLLPDMEFAVNGLAEPRVIVPSDRMSRLLQTCAPKDTVDGTRMKMEIMDLKRQNLWQVGTRSCPEESPSRSIVAPNDPPGLGLPFIENATASKDWCQNRLAAVSHGMFSAPFSLKITDTLVPIFSHGKPSTAQDILYPSPDYLDGYRHSQYDDAQDTAWEEKVNEFYWSGKDTGAYATGDNWKTFHRQRFVDAVTNPKRDIDLLKHVGGRWQKYGEKMAGLVDLAKVKFTDVFACDKKTCEEERKALPTGEKDPSSVAYKYRYLFDVDGQGRTQRYYRLLGSRATVVKQTMHREWHDDRLVPWVHFVPFSIGMQELPEIMRFLARTESGQKISKDIAYQGREWQQRALREEDLRLGFLRLLLEYGRLVSPERDESGYCPDDRTREH